jgi:serine protease Do
MRFSLPRAGVAVVLALVASVPAVRAANGAAASATPLHTLFEERTRCLVAVEFFVETEVDRRPSTVVGLVADDAGLVVVLDAAIPGWLPPSHLKDFRVYAPGGRDGVAARYLGQDFLTGWHFLRAETALVAQVVPCSRFAAAVPQVGDEIWGVGLMGKDLNFQPYLMAARVSLVQELPQKIGFTVSDVASPGAPVFSLDGRLLGWAANSAPQERLLFLDKDRYNVGLQNPNATASFYLTSEVLPYLDRVPTAPTGQPIPWLGVIGLQPLDPEVAAFLKLEDHSAVVVSDVVKGGPAEAAGLRERDILVSIEGEAFPRFRPDRVVTNYLEREVLRRAPGDVIRFGIMRGTARSEIGVTLGRQPKPLKEAERRYFDRLGITLREFVLYDRIARRFNATDEGGVVANFVKPNSPAATAGLAVGDLVREIDGEAVPDYAAGVRLLDAIEKDTVRGEFVLLISRGAETSVIRVRLK